MKRKLALFLALLVLGTVLCACQKEPQTVTAGELSLILPGEYTDQSDLAPGYALAYGARDQAVMAKKEPFTVFEEYGLELDLPGYAALLREANGITEPMEQEDGLAVFRFSEKKSGKTYTYLATVLQGSDAFWLVQAGCPAEKFDKNRERFLEILKSVQVVG